MRRGRAAWLILASVLALGGCVAAPGNQAASSPTELPLRGPLEEVIGFGQVDGPAGLVEAMMLEASTTAVCMSRLGFEYYPDIPAVADIEEATGPEWGSREFAERYGYGLWIEPDEMSGGFGWAHSPNPEARAYLSSLSATAREAYETALRGDIVSQKNGTTHREGGCAELAQEGLTADDPFLRGVREAAIEYFESLPGDPAFAQLDAEWSECMAGEGLRYRSPHEARESFMASVQEYFEDGDHGGIEPLKTPHALERAEEEMRVALADLECRESLDYDRRHTVIAYERQADYIAEHRADLDLLVEASAE